MIKVAFFTFNPFQENTYILYNEKNECAIIDPGCYSLEEKQQLRQWIEVRGLHVKYLLNTHGHIDHIFGNRFVAEEWAVQPWLHPLENELYNNAPQTGMRYGIPFEHYTGPRHPIDENTDIAWGEDRIKVLFTPGHSPGSVSFYLPDYGFVLGGDVLFREGIGRYDLPGGDKNTLFETIQARFFTLPDDTIVYPGHGEPTTVGYEKLHNPFLKESL